MSTITTTILNNIENQLASPNPNLFIIPCIYDSINNCGILQTSFNSILNAINNNKLCLIQYSDENSLRYLFISRLELLIGKNYYEVYTSDIIFGTEDPTENYINEIIMEQNY